MRFFTPAWLRGEVERDALQEYERHLLAIDASLPESARAIARGPSLHDGLIRQVLRDEVGQEFVMRLRCGDLERGYEDIDLTYIGTNASACRLTELRAIAGDGQAELLYDEFDLLATRMVHRLLFTGDREVAIVCRDLRVRREAVGSRAFDRQPDSF